MTIPWQLTSAPESSPICSLLNIEQQDVQRKRPCNWIQRLQNPDHCNGVIEDWALKTFSTGEKWEREAFCSCILASFLSRFDSGDWQFTESYLCLRVHWGATCFLMLCWEATVERPYLFHLLCVYKRQLLLRIIITAWLDFHCSALSILYI